MHDPLTTPAVAWLRAAPDDPAAVILICPAVTVSEHVGTSTRDRLLALLLAAGFRLLTDPGDPLPDLDTLTATFLNDDSGLCVRDQTGAVLYDGALSRSTAFDTAVAVTGRLGVIVTTGLDLYDDSRDQPSELLAAISDGRAVGAAVWLDPGDRPRRHRAHRL